MVDDADLVLVNDGAQLALTCAVDELERPGVQRGAGRRHADVRRDDSVTAVAFAQGGDQLAADLSERACHEDLLHAIDSGPARPEGYRTGAPGRGQRGVTNLEGAGSPTVPIAAGTRG